MREINRVWLGGEMPQNFKDFGDEWRDLNPDWLVHDWTEEEIFDTQWINQQVLDVMIRESQHPQADKIAFYTHFVDVICYEIAYSGGWYFNCDLKPIKPLSALSYPRNVPAMAYEDDIHLVNSAMYGAGKDTFYEMIIENLPRRYFGMPRAYMHETTGAQLIVLTRSQYTGELTTFHRDVFNPIHFSQIELGEEPDLNQAFPEETVAVHLWGHRGNRRGHRIIP